MDSLGGILPLPERDVSERSRQQIQQYSGVPDATPGFARPTDVKGLPDPSGAIKNYCTNCGRSMKLGQPADRPLAARITTENVTVEIFDRGEQSAGLMALIQVLVEALRSGRR